VLIEVSFNLFLGCSSLLLLDDELLLLEDVDEFFYSTPALPPSQPSANASIPRPVRSRSSSSLPTPNPNPNPNPNWGSLHREQMSPGLLQFKSHL
jgi:hypothetical protein